MVGHFSRGFFQESIVGAQKFVEGKGRHGKFNVTPMGGLEPWEVEFEAMKDEHAKSKSKSETKEEQRRGADNEKMD